MKNFRRISSDPGSARLLLAGLAEQPHRWDEITARQQYPGSAHHDTRCIFLRGPAELTPAGVQQSLDAVDYPALEALPGARLLLRLVGLNLFARELGRAMLVELRPGGVIDWHADQGAYAEHFQRFHLCLSGESCLFHCGDEVVVMQPGELWWFDHRTEHYVRNAGPIPRVHLIVDAVV